MITYIRKDERLTENMPKQTKICNTCKKEKSLKEFYTHNTGAKGKSPYCKECWKLQNKQYRSRPEYTEKRRWYKIKATYGLSQTEWQYRFNEQNGCCAICGRHQSELSKVLCVDHDHNTRKVRGLLCNNCNRVLGLLHDDVELLQKALEYLQGE